MLAGLADDTILADVKAKLPDSNADKSHITFYRSRLKKERRVEISADQGDGERVVNRTVPNMGQFGKVEIGGVTFILYGSMIKTDQAVAREYRKAIFRAYVALTGDDRLAVRYELALRVVRGAVNKAWYEEQDKPVPPRLLAHLEEYMARAKQTVQEEEAADETPVKKERISAKSIIRNGLLAGTKDEDILEEVKATFPDSKADSTHLSYYRSELYKEGLLEKPARAAKAAAEEEVPETPAPKAKKGKAAPAPAPKAAKRAPARR